VARALINKPNIFADEPSGNLIPHQQKTYINYFKLRDEFGQTL
jgi:ABC-type ATPase involved in cell division